MDYKIYGNKEIFEKKLPVTLTIGNFDGFHLGHQFLVSYVLQNFPQPVGIILFDPHPAQFFKPNFERIFLSSLNERIENILNFGVDFVLVQKFNDSFSNLSADDFCEKWLYQKFNVHNIILGHDFSYGKDRQGNFEHMKIYGLRFGWNIEKVSPFSIDKIVVSSTLIRHAIHSGDMRSASKYLGKPFSLHGVVVKGDQRGRTIGFPTANIALDESVIVPKYGVYACFIEIDKYPGQLFQGVINCGVRPTVSNVTTAQVEGHILDFDEDIYGQKIIFHMKEFIRSEMKFNSLNHLKDQILKDVLETRSFLQQKQ